MAAPLPILTFEPQYKHVVWGGDRIAAFKGVASQGHDIGESWEVSGMEGRASVVTSPGLEGASLPELIKGYGAALVGRNVSRRYGEEFPLLVKIIDARRDLSVQVHPTEAMARREPGRRSKEEMWYCLAPEPGAYLYAGFNNLLERERYDASVEDGGIVNHLMRHEVAAGDVYHLPSGTVHAIGPGNLILEIQQASDVTYRIWDWGRGRELHRAEACEAIFGDNSRVEVKDDIKRPLPLVTPHFVVDRLDIEGVQSLKLEERDSFTILFVAVGSVEAVDSLGRRTMLHRGMSALIPACHDEVTLHGRATLITVFVP